MYRIPDMKARLKRLYGPKAIPHYGGSRGDEARRLRQIQGDDFWFADFQRRLRVSVGLSTTNTASFDYTGLNIHCVWINKDTTLQSRREVYDMMREGGLLHHIPVCHCEIEDILNDSYRSMMSMIEALYDLADAALDGDWLLRDRALRVAEYMSRELETAMRDITGIAKMVGSKPIATDY